MKPRRNPKKIRNPDVVGAYIYLGNLTSMTRRHDRPSDVFVAFKTEMRTRKIAMPKNSKTRAQTARNYSIVGTAPSLEFAMTFWVKPSTRYAGLSGRAEDFFPEPSADSNRTFKCGPERECILGYFKPRIDFSRKQDNLI